jgi:hypothetical protein
MGDDDRPGESERFHSRKVAIDVRTDLGLAAYIGRSSFALSTELRIGASTSDNKEGQ